MSTDLIPLPTFEGREIRALEDDGELRIPIADLSTAWGVHRNTLGDIIHRNLKKFEGFHFSLAHDTRAANLHCVNERGLYLLIGAINTDRLKNPDAAAAILRFQRWVPELIQKFRKGEIQQQDQELDEVIAYDLIEAKQIAKLTDTDPKILQAAILRKHGYPEIADAIRPAITHGEIGWFNPSQLVLFCNDPLLTAERLNHYLSNNPKDPDRRPFQFKEGYLWRLTPLGMEHGKEYMYTAPSQHKELRIAWRKSILKAAGLLSARV